MYDLHMYYMTGAPKGSTESISHITCAVGTQKNCLNEKALLSTLSCKVNVYPFMPNGISPPYQMDESISNLRVIGW